MSEQIRHNGWSAKAETKSHHTAPEGAVNRQQKSKEADVSPVSTNAFISAWETRCSAAANQAATTFTGATIAKEGAQNQDHRDVAVIIAAQRTASHLWINDATVFWSVPRLPATGKKRRRFMTSCETNKAEAVDPRTRQARLTWARDFDWAAQN